MTEVETPKWSIAEAEEKYKELDGCTVNMREALSRMDKELIVMGYIPLSEFPEDLISSYRDEQFRVHQEQGETLKVKDYTGYDRLSKQEELARQPLDQLAKDIL